MSMCAERACSARRGRSIKANLSNKRRDEVDAFVFESHHIQGGAPKRRHRAMQDLTLKDDRLWHSEPVEEALERCRSSTQGLSADEAARRLEADGPNRLPAGKP